MSKSTFKTVLIELLGEIFQLLPQLDLFQCQKVCRSWYLPAHLLILKQVRLVDNSRVDAFLEAIGGNRSYARAVNRLRIGDDYHTESVDITHAERLLSSLQDIQDLTIAGNATFANLVKDAGSRESIIQLCRNVQKVKCTAWVGDTETYIKYLVKGLKDSLTYLDLMDSYSIEFLSGFPCLQHLCFRESSTLVNFEAWLPLFEQQYTLKSLQGDLTSNDRDNFLDRYVQLKSKQDRELLVEKLSNVKSLVLEDKTLCPNSVRFMSRYFTGVRDFRYSTWFFAVSWSEMQIRSFCGDFLDFSSALQGGCSISVRNLGESTFVRLLPAVVEKIFHRLPSNFRHVEKQLRISIFNNTSHHFTEFSPLDIRIESNKISNFQARRLVDIRLGINNSVTDQIKESVSKSCNIESFIFDSPFSCLSVFQQMLEMLPTLKTVVLYMLDSCKPPEEPIKQYYLVEQLEINVDYEIRRRPLLDSEVFTFEITLAKCIAMFPRAQKLKLHYFSGFWIEETKQFEIPLYDLNLKNLCLDVTPVLSKIYDNPVALDNSYFLLCVHTTNQRYLYQISFDYLTAIKIDNDKILSQDHIRVNINVESLSSITFCLYKDFSEEAHDGTYLETCMENVTKGKLLL